MCNMEKYELYKFYPHSDYNILRWLIFLIVL